MGDHSIENTSDQNLFDTLGPTSDHEAIVKKLVAVGVDPVDANEGIANYLRRGLLSSEKLEQFLNLYKTNMREARKVMSALHSLLESRNTLYVNTVGVDAGFTHLLEQKGSSPKDIEEIQAYISEMPEGKTKTEIVKEFDEFWFTYQEGLESLKKRWEKAFPAAN